LLDHLGFFADDGGTRVADLRRPVIRNHTGLEVGALTAEARVLEEAR